MNIFKELGLKEVVNACGKMTILGISTSSETVSASVKASLENFVILPDLMDLAGDVIASVTQSEAGCPTASAASGIAISVAACITGCNKNLIERLPDSSGLNNEVIIQKGHVVNFGANIAQMIRMGGGAVLDSFIERPDHHEPEDPAE